MKRDDISEGIEIRKTLIIRNRMGLHARPAALFVQKANKFRSEIKVRKGKLEVDGKSIIALLTLEADEGSIIEIIVRGIDAREAMDVIEEIIKG